jgi:class 3 adenylate cyclase/predicted ATPase
MKQIATWLQKLGMSEYAQRFADNDIDVTVLPHLSDQDLKELGVSLGHRRKMLAAIAELAGAAPASQHPVLVEAKPQDNAERRQLTVMFADLVGSTALAARMDPEDLREVVAAYHRCAGETVRRVGGFVSQYLGDGVLVYFGYPQAHEDDAERAVRASLDLVAAVAALKTRTALQTRVGIATGLVVVGDVVDAGGSQERGIIGETPNLAARLQGIAQPNTVIIAESTRRLLGDLFELQDLGARELKGIAAPVRAWSALRGRSVESRFEALHTSGLSALVGREEETQMLLRRWSRAKTGEGQVVLLSGEPGIGKSRLTAALLEHLALEPHTRLRYFCSPQHTGSVLYPFIGQMERAAELAHEDSPQERLEKLDALMAQTSTSNENVTLFAEMLSLPNDGRYPVFELTPQQRRQRTLQALTSQIQALVHQRPVLMIFEDAHWIDPTSLELMGHMVAQIPALRALLLVTFRPEFTAPWIGRPHVTALTINRLAAREVVSMIDHIVGNRVLPASIRKDIVERTDGIPLFVEEMTKVVLEAGSPDEAGKTASVISAGAVPASLHASLMARLDRLGPGKELAQIAAAIGREFSHALLAAVASKPEAELASALDRLIHAGLLFRQGMPPHASYLFKHALVQDAAYGTLLREPRRALHRRIAENLEREFAEIAENQPELLARHCTEAGLIEKAADLWGKAGHRSLLRSAYLEAAEQLTRGLTHMASIPATPTLRRTEIELQLALVNSLFQVKGYAAPETKAAVERVRLLFERAEARGETPADPLLGFIILFHAWICSFVEFNGDDMRELAARVLSLAEEQGATLPLLIGDRITAVTRTFTGHAADALAHFNRSLALYDPAEHRSLASRFGYQDATVSILCYRAFAHWLLGYPEAALADANHALRETREMDLAVTLMFANAIASHTLIECGSYDAANALLDALVVIAEEKGAVFRKAEGTVLKGCVLTLTGKCTAGIQMITLGISTCRSTGALVWMPLYLSHLARAHAELGQYEDSWRSIGEAMTTMEETKELWCEAEVHRVTGEIALKSPKPDAAKAEASFERALEVARKQKAKSLELRAAMSMARLLRDRGERNRAYDVLAPVYEWFTEGHDTLDLKNAKALLDELEP